MSEEKKFFHFFRLFFCSCFVLFLATTSISADDIYTTTTMELLARDSIMQEIIITLADVDNLNKTDEILLKWLNEYPEFEYIIRINSKGKIISKVANNKIVLRDFKYIGAQKWFKAMELLEKPYYGNVIQNKDIYLFWNRPAFIESQKKKKFVGVLSVKINLKKFFRRITEQNNLEFSILYKNQTIFTNLKETNSDNIISRKLSIYGLTGLFIKYEKSDPESKSFVSKVEGKREASQQSTLRSIVSEHAISRSLLSKVQEVKETGKIEFVNSLVDKILNNNKLNLNMFHILLYSVGICLFLFGLCIFLINRAIKKLTSRKI